MIKFSLVTNASAKDGPRLAIVLPHWLRVFGDRLTEICVLVDPRPAEGRIGLLHSVEANLVAVTGLLDRLAAQHPLIRWQMLDYSRLEEVSRMWWLHGSPLRCQDGSPVFAFAFAVLASKGRFILRADCDMLFRENGWLEEAFRQLDAGQVDLVAPPRLGRSPNRVSSRALLFDWSVFSRRFLPMPAAQLDWLRSIHRRVKGRPTCLAFEDSLMTLVKKGRAKFVVLPVELGASMHVARVAEIADPRFERVLKLWENGCVPDGQLEHGWDYLPAGWSGVVQDHVVPSGIGMVQ